MNSTIQQPQLHDIYFPEHKKGHMNYVVQQSTDEGANSSRLVRPFQN